MADTQIVGSVSSEDGITWKLHPGNSASGLKGNTPYKVRPVGPEKTVTTLPELNLQTMTASVSPNPPAAGQPFTVVFSAVPDTAPGLTGTGLTRSGTAPASGNVVINATKEGFNPLQVTAATQPAVAPAATGGALTLFQGSVFLEIPNITAGYPEPEAPELTALTRNGTDILAELVGTDEIPDAVKSTSSTYSATWTITNGVGAGVTITRTLVVAAASITATVAPTSTRLYAGQTPAAITNIATFLDNANYSTGTAQLQVNGENATTTTVLNAGDVVSVLVTAGSVTRRWVLSNVEYAVKFVSKGAGGWAVDINDLISATGVAVTLGIDGVTKTTNRSQIKAGPVRMVDPYITLDGEVFTAHVPEPWINEYSAGAIEYRYQWFRNSTALGGSAPNNATYTRVAADAGTTTSCRIVAWDANGPSAMATTNGIANPAAQTYSDYTRLPGHFVSQSTSAPSAGPVLFPGNDIGAAHPNRKVLLFAGQSGANGGTITGAKAIAGGQTITMTQVRPGQASTATTPNTYLIAYEATVPLGTTCDFEVTYSTPTQSRMIDYLVGVGTTISAHNSGTTGGSTAAITVALSGATVGHKLIAAHLRASSASVDWTGATEIYENPFGTTVRYASGAEGVAPAGGAPSVTATMGGGAQAAMILIAAGA